MEFQDELIEKQRLKNDIEFQTKVLESVINNNDKALYKKLVGKLNKVFYGKNLKELELYLKSKNIEVTKDKVKENFNITHLQMQKFLIIKLRKEILSKKPRKTEDYYRLAQISADAGKEYFIDLYGEEPLENLENIQLKQLEIENISIMPKSKEKTSLKGTKTLEVKNLNVETKDSKQEALKELNKVKNELIKSLSNIGCVRIPGGLAYSLYEKLIVRVYKTKDVKQIDDLINKLNKQLNININSIEEVMPTNHLQEITKAIDKLTTHINNKQNRVTSKTISGVYDYNYTLSTATRESITKQIKEQEPESSRITPYLDLKKKVKKMK